MIFDDIEEIILVIKQWFVSVKPTYFGDNSNSRKSAFNFLQLKRQFQPVMIFIFDVAHQKEFLTNMAHLIIDLCYLFSLIAFAAISYNIHMRLELLW